MRKVKIALSGLIVFSFLLSNVFIAFAKEDYSQYNKMDILIQEKLDEISNYEKISVWVWFSDIDKSKLEADVEAECKINRDDIYISSPELSTKQNELLQTYMSEKGNLRGKEANKIIDDYMIESAPQREEISKQTREYSNCLRKTASKMYEQSNDSIITSNGLSEDNIIFQSSLTPSAILSVTKKDLLSLKNSNDVKKILYYDDNINEEQLDIESSNDTVTDSMKVDKAREEFNVTGSGVNVLMVENGCPLNDTNNVLDYSKIRFVHNENDYSYEEVINNPNLILKATSHSVATTTALQSYADDVTVYSVHRLNDYIDPNYSEYKNIEWAIINRNIDIINCSGNYWFYEDYSSDPTSIWYDSLVSTYYIPMTASIGNGTNFYGEEWHKVLSVAAGYNTIGVGSYYTNEGFPRVCNFRYSSSDYPNAVQNKPDIIVESPSTSEGAPTLAAIASLILEINPKLRLNPELVKAILMASCHQKASPANGTNDAQENMSDGLTLKQGAGIVDAYQAVCIALLGNYGTGRVRSGSVNIDSIKAPSDDDINVSLVWLRENPFTDNNNDGYHDINESTVGTLQELELRVYKNNSLIGTSNKTQTGKQLVYFPYQKNNQYTVRVTKATENSESVFFAYAWSPSSFKKISDLQIEGKVAVGQSLTATVNFTDGKTASYDDLRYRWYSSSDGENWKIISGVTSKECPLTDNEFLKSIRCVAQPKDGTSIFSSTVSGSTNDTIVIKYGDVDMNGIVDITDSTFVQMYVVNATTFNASQKVAADVSGDGIIDLTDATLISLYTTGSISSFPVET